MNTALQLHYYINAAILANRTTSSRQHSFIFMLSIDVLLLTINYVFLLLVHSPRPKLNYRENICTLFIKDCLCAERLTLTLIYRSNTIYNFWPGLCFVGPFASRYIGFIFSSMYIMNSTAYWLFQLLTA